MRIGVQLYTLRDQIDQDLEGTLRAISDAGIEFVELAGLAGRSAGEFQESLCAAGLKAVAAHDGIDRYERGLDGALQQASEMGYRDLVLPWVDASIYEHGWGQAGQRFATIAVRAESAGARFHFHNHAFEFELESGRPGFDVLMAATEESPLRFELDTWWVAHANLNPARYISALHGRISLVHLKDARHGEPFQRPLGQGVLDWDAILPACADANVEYGIIELDHAETDPLAAVAASAEFLRSRGLR